MFIVNSLLCSKIDFNNVLNNNNSFLRYKMSFLFFSIVQSMRESMATKHIYIYIYIYIQMLLILTCSQMFFLVVCILLNQIPAPQMNPDDFLQTVFNAFPLPFKLRKLKLRIENTPNGNA